MEILIIFILILLNGIFSMSEIALVSSRKIRLENSAKKGNKQAKEALKLANNPGKFFSTVQIGITLIGILTGIYSGDKITDDLAVRFAEVSYLKDYAEPAAVICVLMILTFFSLVLGELVPKKIGLSNPEGIAKIVARPMRILSIIAAPFVWTLTFTTDLIIKLFRIKPSTDNAVTEEEIKAIVQEGAATGEVQEIEQDIVARVFSLGDRKVGSLMTHRTDLVMIHADFTNQEIIQTISSDMHSVYPVYDDNKQDITGIIKLKEVVMEVHNKDFQLSQFIREPHYIPETASAYDALQNFKDNKIHYALITDEFGHVDGLISLNDILEALVGNATDFDFDEPAITQREDGTWLIDGQYPFADFLHYFEMEDFIQEYDFNTVSGLLLDELKNIPKVGDKVIWNDYKFEVIDMDGARIDKVLLQKMG